jgi:serine/threonine-protein kinase/endoribonuclease IRE1
MSGSSYPLITRTEQAQCAQQGWWQHGPLWEDLNEMQLSDALVGVHKVESVRVERPLTISPPLREESLNESSFADTTPALLGPPSVLQTIKQLPSIAANSLLEFIKNPVMIIFLIAILISNQRQLRTWIGSKGGLMPMLQRADPTDLPALDQASETTEKEVIEVAIPDEPSKLSEIKDQELEAVEVETVVEKEESPALLEVPSQSNVEKPTPEKKKAHRGRRGGIKHKKGRAASQDPVPTKLPPTIEDAVRDAQNLGEQTKLEPDIHTISNDPAEVTGPIIRVGALEVNTEKLIGTGSNGTMVFEGNFDGREVAVKRMLMQFFDIASQETKLLRESDDHPNVIRYFAQQQAAGFLYIALELCPASLADVIEKPQLHRDLAQGGERDLPNVLYQITNGLQHLHSLRIVHRDLKPQNILVAMGKDGKPRLLVSDFGLCKKLEGEQSSFRATTAHAAGTSGWRAPELLLDDDAKEGYSMIDASTHSGSGSVTISSELMPNRRATRAIDIFSLGLVFFYVLTKGSHPFDCGDRYMREVNIRKGKFNLRLLEVLGDYAFEAMGLITSMLAPEPKLRPQARQVMAHPFFWSAKKRLNFLCDVSDHFEKEKRDPPSPALQELERWAPEVCRGDFLRSLGKEFVESMGKQRKYTGTRLLDLLRALRNKKNHYEDMSDKLKKDVGPLPDGYLSFWTRKFPNLLITCWNVVYEVQWEEIDRFVEYYLPAGL